MKVLKTIQIVWTILAVIAIFVEARLAWWIHSMAMFDPVRHEWEPRFHLIVGILSFGVVLPWILFSFVHFALRIIREDVRSSA